MRPRITFHLKFGLLSLVLLLLAFIPRSDDPVDKLVTILQRWTDSIPQEKVYLQTDKPYYALGDTIWFKGYVTIGSRHQLSALSGSLYVDLINEQDSVVRALKLPITAGMAIGNFILGDDYKQGSYRIRSYTQWMRNAGDEYFYDHTFTIGDLASDNIIVKADYGYKQVDGKNTLSALLNYANDEGKPIAGKDVHYQVIIDKKAVWSRSATTDASGNIPVNIVNDKQANLAGAYIHTTLDGNDKHTIVRDFPIKANLAQSDVQFFPEGGELVNGISSHIAFKAVGVDGLGIDIKGKIVDNENNEVADLTTLHAGMGSFLLRPQAGKTYIANITLGDGTSKVIPLPKANDEGLVLSVYQPNKDSVLIRINAAKSSLQSTVGLIAHSGGETVYASAIKLTAPVTSIWLDKKSFPTGIAQFTLFNNSGDPLNERIAFIRSNDLLDLNIQTAKTTYSSKEHIKIDLTANDGKGKPTVGNFSVAVIDESKVPVDENNESSIFSNLLLTSDLKGYIEKPNYYFVKRTEETDKALDDLMLTQGYRRFEWKNLTAVVNSNPVFKAEGLGVAISGKVTTLGNKILPNADVMMLALKAGVHKTTTADINGRFKFDGIFMTDSIKFTIQARNGKSDKVKVILDTISKVKLAKNRNMPDVSTNITGTLKAYLDNIKKEDDIYERTGQLDKVHRLREVRINARKARQSDAGITPQGMFKVPEASADKVIYVDPDEASRYLTLASYLQGRMQGISVVQGEYGSALQELGARATGKEGIALYIDGRKLIDAGATAEALDGSYLPEDIAKIQIVRTNRAMVSFLGGPAVLILTRLGTSRKEYNPATVNVSPKGFNRVREFYSPRYDRPGNANSQPDLRTTVYWNPYLKTDETGKTSFNFFNADGPGTYRVVVEGINADGQLGRQVFRYTVDGDKMNSAIAAGSGPLSAIASPVNTDKNLSFITAPLDSLNKRLPVEKVYLHTDKPYYNIGDTLWFKSYLLDRVNLTASHLSGLLYVELDNDSTEMVRRISIPIKDGMGWAQIPLPKTIFHEGGYTLRAYTNWMQNFGEDYVFSQRFYLGVPTTEAWLVKSSSVINRVEDKDQLQVDIKINRADKIYSPVALRKVKVKLYEGRYFIAEQTLMTGIDGSLKFTERLKEKKDGRNIRAQIMSLESADRGKVVQVPLIIRRNQNIDLQFLPEGGKLVAGLSSVVGFKALAEDGKGTPVAGSVLDSKGNTVVSFAAIHNGMGSLEFVPKANEVYTAKIEQPKGAIKTYPLPVVNPVGTVLHIDNRESSEELVVSLSGLNSLAVDSACYLIGTSRGVIYYSQKVEPNQSNITVSKKLFPSGIAKFTLFKGKRPLNERAVFIDNHDQLSISIKPNKTAYQKRDSVSLSIEVKDKSGSPVQGNFSLAVTDDSQVKPDSLNNNGIATSLLLNSELKGHIESPGYYINRKDKQAWQALDNLLLTQGWTGYDWKDVFSPAKPVKFEAEKEFKITGRVSNITNKPVANAPVLISSQKPQFVTTTTTDADGVYTFRHLPTIDSGSFFIQASNSKGKKLSFGNTSVNKFIPPAVPETLRDPVIPWYINTDSTQLNYVKRVAAKADEENLKLTGNVLKQVNIKEKKIIPNSRNTYGAGNADLVYDEKDIKESGVQTLYDLLLQKVPGFRVIGAQSLEFRGTYEEIPVMAMGKNYAIDLRIDGWPLTVDVGVGIGYGTDPVEQLDNTTAIITNVFKYNPYRSQTIDELREYKIAGLKGLEIAYSRKYTNRTKFVEFDWAKIDITTTNGAGWYRNYAPGTTTYRPLPIMYPQQFYSPKYNVAPKLIEPDYRSTLYWEPNIYTDHNGKAKVSFYTSDIKGKYTAIISGTDGNGWFGGAQVKLSQ
ncbi:MAG: carboxypeptidase regulatory-like domain-containing protein [Bacteroidota bacterium]